MISRMRIFLLTLFTAFFSLGQSAPAQVFDAKHTTLKNGLEIYVIENARAPVVTHMLWYKAGAADEPRGKSGIAHFLEHLMFKGSEVVGGEALSPGEFSRIVRRLGGNDNAFTSQDYTAYFQSVPLEHLERVMRMEAGRMMSPLLPEDEVLSEKQVVLEERRQRTDNNPLDRFQEYMRAALFVNHPYANPVIGWYHEIETLTRQDALDFHDAFYTPSNAMLIVSGAAKAEDVFALAEEIYGIIPARQSAARSRTETPGLKGTASLASSDPVTQEPVFQRIYRVPSARQDDESALALQVLDEILGGGSTSRLYRALVIDQKIASSIGTYYSPNSWNDSQFWISATPLPGISMAELETAIDQEIAKLADETPSTDEIETAITRMQADAIYALDSVTGPAMLVGHALITGSSLDDIEYWPERIATVTASDVQNAARRFFAPDSADSRFVTGTLLPEEDPS